MPLPSEVTMGELVFIDCVAHTAEDEGCDSVLAISILCVGTTSTMSSVILSAVLVSFVQGFEQMGLLWSLTSLGAGSGIEGSMTARGKFCEVMSRPAGIADLAASDGFECMDTSSDADISGSCSFCLLIAACASSLSTSSMVGGIRSIVSHRAVSGIWIFRPESV